MKRKNQEIVDKNIIEKIIQNSEICRIAIFNEDFPYIVPVNYGYSENCIYVHTSKTGKKLDLLKKNNNVSFEIEEKAEIIKNDEACRWATKYRSVIGQAKVEIIDDFEQKKIALNIIMSHYGKTENLVYVKKHVDSIVILKLNILKLSAKKSSNWEK